MSRQILKGDHASFQDIPATMKAATVDVMAEAAAARSQLRDTAAQLADDMRSAAQSVQLHARRARAVGGSVARDAMETGMKAGSHAWHEARRHAAQWGGVAMKQARSRPAAVLVGMAVIGVAVGFWLRGAARRASAASARDSGESASRTRRSEGASARSAGARKANGRSGGRRGNSTTAPSSPSAH
ncbi:MAG: hypothetical protein ACTHK2_09250 [Dokdonella sp.]|uniref:hypothetical protein n=1 Tax=Dokdonella sp. TaxID=2291710 RepID=UPI003F7F06E5